MDQFEVLSGGQGGDGRSGRPVVGGGGGGGGVRFPATVGVQVMGAGGGGTDAGSGRGWGFISPAPTENPVAVRQWLEVLPDGTWQVDLIEEPGTWTWTKPDGALECRVTLIGGAAGPNPGDVSTTVMLPDEFRSVVVGQRGYDDDADGPGLDGLCMIRTKVPDGTKAVTGGVTLDL